jgi:ElaB/YqjD/DUF883 family membrane-anchored ribosome-binding protein
MSNVMSWDKWARGQSHDSGRDDETRASENRTLTGQRANQLVDHVGALVRNRPGLALATAVAAGVMVGWIIKRR